MKHQTIARIAATVVSAAALAAIPSLPGSAAPIRALPLRNYVNEEIGHVTVTAGSVATVDLILPRFRNQNVGFQILGIPKGSSAKVSHVAGDRYSLAVHIGSHAPTSTLAITLRAKSSTLTETLTAHIDVAAQPATVLAAPAVAVAVVPTTVVPASVPASVVPTTVAPTVATTTPTPATQLPATQPLAFQGTFLLHPDNPVITVTAGQTAEFGITVARSGLAGVPIALTVTGIPQATQYNFAPNPTVDSTGLFVTPSAATPTGQYVLNIAATTPDGLQVQLGTVILNVSSIPDFALGVPAIVAIQDATTTNIPITLQNLAVNPATVSLTVNGLPTTMSTYFSPNPTFGDTTLVATSFGTPVGSYAAVITGTAGSMIHSYPITVNVVAAPVPTTTVAAATATPIGGFGLAANNAAVQLSPGSAGEIVVTATPVDGFNSPITYTLAGVPAGVTANVVATSATTESIQFVVPANVVLGSYPITITGTSGTLVASIVTTLTVG